MKVVYHFDLLSRYSRMTQFRENREKTHFLHLFSYLVISGFKIQKTFFVKNEYLVIVIFFDLLCHFAGMSQSREF